MSELTKCPKCYGEMRKGEIFVNVKVPSRELMNISPLMGGYPTIGLPSQPGVSVERVLWQEYTGEEKGWLIKQKEQKTLSLKGKRCLECGYVELYVKE
jgi:predicted nucleic-acid-binding Zn-ribbon protein